MEDSVLELLRMVKDGARSVEGAARDLEVMMGGRVAPRMGALQSPKTLPAKLLRVRLHEAGQLKANVALPPSLARLALGLIPRDKLQGVTDGQMEELFAAANGGLIGTLFDYEDGQVRYEIIVEA